MILPITNEEFMTVLQRCHFEVMATAVKLGTSVGYVYLKAKQLGLNLKLERFKDWRNGRGQTEGSYKE